MKKYLIGLLVLSFVLVSTFGVLAIEHGDWVENYWEGHGYGEDIDVEEGCYYEFQDDGIVIWINEWDPENGDYTFLPFDREGFTYDVNGILGGKFAGTPGDNDQQLEIMVPVQAFIPCYLELTITGNQGKTGIKSFGPLSTGDVATGNTQTGEGYGIIFDNEIGGFIDEDWNCVGRGSNFNLHDVDGDVYIGACDIMMVEAYGNEAYRYEVEGGPLAHVDGNGGDPLTMFMRSSFDEGTSWPYETEFDSVFVEDFDGNNEYAAGDAMEALHYFKVPVSTNIMHGMYEGEVIFRIVSI